MENIRIIPRLDIKGLNVVKGMHTEGLRVVGNPRDFALRYYNEGADELLYMDIVASLYQRNLDFDLLKSVADGVFIPITVGGGIRSIGDIYNALRAGADKVAINTYPISNPKFIKEAANKFGSQCITLSVEAKKIGEGKWEAYTDGGREKTGIDAVDWVKRAIDYGIGEVLITSIDKEGTRRGYDHDLVGAITAFANIPVIAHGGAGDMASVRDVVSSCRTNAVSAASAFHYKDYSIQELKKFLKKEKINVRLE